MEENFEERYENNIESKFFSVALFLLSSLLLMGTLQGGSISFFPPTLTIKLCHAQLNHQDGATTARPHAARVTQTGSRSREQLGMFSLGAPRASSRGKQYKTPTA